MDKSTVRQILLDQQAFFKGDSDLIERDVNIENIYEGNEIIVISGIRRCGKSSLLRLISEKVKHTPVLINFDDIRFSGFQVQDYPLLDETIWELFPQKVVYFLDEVQNVDLWERWVNNLHGRGEKVFLTCSNSNLLSSDISTYLTGRNKVIELSTFSFSEMLRLDDISLDDPHRLTSTQRATIVRRFNRYLELGGFPEVLKSNDNALSRHYFQDILMKDIIVRHRLQNPGGLKELALFLISNACSPFSYASLKKVSGVKSISTIKRYLDYLEAAYLIRKVNRFSYSIRKQKAVPAKVYAGDIGFLTSVAFNFSANMGKRLENLVLNHLLRHYSAVYYHIEKKECDFVVKRGPAVKKAIQVSYSMTNPSTRKREVEGLVDAMERYGLTSGTIITMDEEAEEAVNDYRVTIVPAWKWALDRSSG